jgi:hypothetical protein
MQDKEHEEWLENQNARKAAAKKHAKTKPALPQKKDADKRKTDDTDEEDSVRAWVID